ncbi:hypothetical protein EXU57_22645 [Segetibacter sp. 3557_3]|nr:hypothetical protein EXU57_22645 [Segetibacter sp. 3557_3]
MVPIEPEPVILPEAPVEPEPVEVEPIAPEPLAEEPVPVVVPVEPVVPIDPEAVDPEPVVPEPVDPIEPEAEPEVPVEVPEELVLVVPVVDWVSVPDPDVRVLFREVLQLVKMIANGSTNSILFIM